jgi:hypothetical protein
MENLWSVDLVASLRYGGPYSDFHHPRMCSRELTLSFFCETETFADLDFKARGLAVTAVECSTFWNLD